MIIWLEYSEKLATREVTEAPIIGVKSLRLATFLNEIRWKHKISYEITWRSRGTWNRIYCETIEITLILNHLSTFEWPIPQNNPNYITLQRTKETNKNRKNTNLQQNQIQFQKMSSKIYLLHIHYPNCKIQFNNSKSKERTSAIRKPSNDLNNSTWARIKRKNCSSEPCQRTSAASCEIEDTGGSLRPRPH